MTLWEIFRFELAYQARRPWPWLFLLVLVVVDFLMTRDGTLSEALYAEFLVNSPFAIAKTTVFGGLIWLLIAGAIAGEAGARDVATAMHPLVYTAPVSKGAYLGGRFLAALALNLVLLLGVQAGILLALYAPGVDPTLLGPFRPAAFLTAYAYLAVPNAIVATTLQFALALRTGRPMAAYLGSFVLLFMGFFVAAMLLFRRSLGTLLDPIGVRFVLDDLSHLWTTTEKSWRLLALEGSMLQNRLLWLGVAAATMTVAFARFRFAHRVERPWWRRRSSRAEPAASAPIAMLDAVPDAPRSFGAATRVRQVVAVATESLGSIARSWAGLAMLVGLPLLTVLVVIDQMEAGGAPLSPATGLVLKELTGPLSSQLSRWVVTPFLVIFFAGELLWREREAGLGEIADAAPVPEWVPLLGKLLGLALLLAGFLLLLAVAGMVAQTALGYHHYEAGLYLRVLLGLQLPEYLLFAVLAVAVHVLADQKYVGHLLAIVVYVVILLAPMFGIEHDLLIFGAGPWWSYTEMRGLGPYVAPWLWFKLYWAGWALLLAVGARLLWVRGRERGAGARLRLARRRLGRATVLAAATALGIILSTGGFVLYNTNVLNEYRTDATSAARSAEYERRYARFAAAPQPRLAGASLRVELHPARREAEIRGAYRLVNRATVAIDSIHLAIPGRVETSAIAFDRAAAPVLVDDTLGHRIYALARPLQPGDSLRLDFRVRVAPRGFRESGPDVAVVANGTYFTNALLPAIGYQRSRELATAGERREHGLRERPVIPSLDDAREAGERNGGTALDVVMGTDAGQVAVAPGALRREWTEGGRRWFHYATDAPIGGEWSFASADYAVREARWRDVVIRVLHHPAHTAQLAWMVPGIQAALEHYAARFGAYPRRYLTVLEIPGDGVGMHAEPGMLRYSEGVTRMHARSDAGSLDFPLAMTAHEMAHQWTVPSAFVEGAPVMSESVAWYYALDLLESTRGLEQLRQQLRFMREPYPIAPIRRGEPLLRGLDPYMSYRRGPFALLALREYAGAERVNGALRRLVERHRAEGAPLATTRDLYRELRAATPDSLRPLLRALFEVNTVWAFDTKRGTAARNADGTWRVTLDVAARKTVFDSAGAATELPLDDWVEIGVFAPAAPGEPLGALLYRRMHRVTAGRQTITVTVPRQPDRAGIDPYNLLDWEQGDNIEGLTIGSRP